MKKHILSAAFLAALIALAALIFPAGGTAGGKSMEEVFAPVMKLRGTVAEGEINAIANLLGGESGIMAIDLTNASNEFCMLERRPEII